MNEKMNMKNWLFIALAFVVFSGNSYAEQPVTKERQQLFKKIENNTEMLEDLVDELNWEKSERLANQVSQDVLKLKQLFPKESIGDGRSKKKILKEWPSFEKKINDWSLFYRQVEKASKARDENQVENAMDEASSACRSCHMKYRSLW
jgi:cytochrome c556